jgi:hypothetical protein
MRVKAYEQLLGCYWHHQLQWFWFGLRLVNDQNDPHSSDVNSRADRIWAVAYRLVCDARTHGVCCQTVDCMGFMLFAGLKANFHLCVLALGDGHKAQSFIYIISYSVCSPPANCTWMGTYRMRKFLEWSSDWLSACCQDGMINVNCHRMNFQSYMQI